MGSTVAAGVGVERWSRDMPPAHFIFKIRSFSLLSKTGAEKFESGVFEACDKKWKLCVVYPTRKFKAKGEDEEHISLYLQIVDSDKLPGGWEIQAMFSLFVVDHIRNNYLTIQDGGAKTRRLNCMKTEHGFDRLLPWSTFNDPCNGYLVNDTCAFGAEILSVSSATKHECVSLVKAPIKNGSYTWKIDSFLTLKKCESYNSSDEFIVEGRKWQLLLYPSGDSRACGKHLSFFLMLLDFEDLIAHGRKIYANFILRIRNQVNILRHEEVEVAKFFAASSAWGSAQFMKLSELESSSNEFVVEDTLIAEVEFKLLSKYS